MPPRKINNISPRTLSTLAGNGKRMKKVSKSQKLPPKNASLQAFLSSNAVHGPSAPCTLWFIHVQGSSNIVTDKKGQKAAPGPAARH